MRAGGIAVWASGQPWCAAICAMVLVVGASEVAEAQAPPLVNGEPTYCLTPGSDGVCVVGGTWTQAGGVFSVTGTPRVRFPGGIELGLAPGASSLAIGTTPETASLNANAALRYAGAGPLAGMGIEAGSVTVRFGRGRDLVGLRELRVGSSTVPIQREHIYLYASFDGESSVRLPGVSTQIPLPLPSAGLSSALLVAFDPRSPGSVLFFLGGGFTSLLTQGIVADGAVLFALSTRPGAPMAQTDLGRFRASSVGTNEVTRVLTPSFQAEGTLSLFQDDGSDASRRRDADSQGAQASQRQPPPPDGKPVPLTIAGMLSYDFDGNDDGIPAFVQGYRDMRYGGRTSVTLDDVGLGQSLMLGTGTFYVNPGDGDCGATGEMLLRVDSVSNQVLAGTPLAFLDPGTAGYRFDARVCGRETMMRLEAGTVTAGQIPLGNVAIGFGFGGVDVAATLRMLGADYRLSGRVEPNAVRLVSNGDVTLVGERLASGSISVALRRTSASGRVRGFVRVAGHRFELNEAFVSPPVDRLDTGDLDVAQQIEIDRVGTDAIGASAKLRLSASARAFVSNASWGVRIGGGVDYEVSTWGPAGRDTLEGSWDTALDLGSNGISASLPGLSVNVAGTRLQVIPSGRQRFASPDFDEPREQPEVVVVAPAVATALALSSNVRAASTNGLASPRVLRQDVLVTLEGSIEKTTGTLGVIGRLPRGLRPSSTLYFSAMSWPRAAGASGVTLALRSNGELSVVTPSATLQGLSLDGISFSLRPGDGVTPGLASGVVAGGADVEPPVAIARGPFIRLQGTVRRAAGNGPWTQIVRLPASMRRISKTLTFELVTSAGAVRANLTDDGWLTHKSGPDRFDWLSLSGIELTSGTFARRPFDYASGVRDDTTGRQTTTVMGQVVETAPPSFLGVRVHRFGGLVWLQGTAEKPNGGIGLIGTLTPSMRPAARMSFHAPQGAGVTAQVDVLPNGEVRLSGGGASREWVSLTGVRFYVAGATDELALARQALIDFSLSLEDGDMKDSWNRQESAWRDRARAASSVAALRTSIDELLDFMPRAALVRAWTDGRDAWRAELASASSAADLARSIRRLFRYTKWSVLDDEWDDLAPGWIAELEGYMAD